MSRASALLVLCLCQSPLLAQADPFLADRADSLIRSRREVPLDPLDGIPEEDPGRGKPTRKPHTGNLCYLSVTPANDRIVADLRSTVAVIQQGPRSVGCPSDLSVLRLRISIDAKGRITSVEQVSGDKRLGDSLTRALTGKHCESTVSTFTKGVAQIQLRRSR